MAESFSVLGCGSTCPPLYPPLSPRGAGKRHLAAPAHWLLQTTTWQRWGGLGEGEERAGDKGWMNGEARAGGEGRRGEERGGEELLVTGRVAKARPRGGGATAGRVGARRRDVEGFGGLAWPWGLRS